MQESGLPEGCQMTVGGSIAIGDPGREGGVQGGDKKMGWEEKKFEGENRKQDAQLKFLELRKYGFRVCFVCSMGEEGEYQ